MSAQKGNGSGNGKGNGSNIDQVVARERAEEAARQAREGLDPDVNMPDEDDLTCWVPIGGC